MDSAAKARYDLICENLAEVINPELIETILAEGRNPRVYWGMLLRCYVVEKERNRNKNRYEIMI